MNTGELVLVLEHLKRCEEIHKYCMKFSNKLLGTVESIGDVYAALDIITKLIEEANKNSFNIVQTISLVIEKA